MATPDQSAVPAATPPTPDEERALAIKAAAEMAESVTSLTSLVKTLVERVEALEEEEKTLLTEEVAQLAETRHLNTVVSALQSQWLWICSAILLFGAAAGYLLTKVLG